MNEFKSSVTQENQFKVDQSPSPATYSPKKDAVMYRAPEWTLGEKQYIDTFKQVNPGPGTYDAGKPFGTDAASVSIIGQSPPTP